MRERSGERKGATSSTCLLGRRMKEEGGRERSRERERERKTGGPRERERCEGKKWRISHAIHALGSEENHGIRDRRGTGKRGGLLARGFPSPLLSLFLFLPLSRQATRRGRRGKRTATRGVGRERRISSKRPRQVRRRSVRRVSPRSLRRRSPEARVSSRLASLRLVSPRRVTRSWRIHVARTWNGTAPFPHARRLPALSAVLIIRRSDTPEFRATRNAIGVPVRRTRTGRRAGKWREWARARAHGHSG